MEITLPALRPEEIITLRLRALFEQRGYRPYTMGSFEEYDFYLQNKSFLMEDDIITFTGADGRLMALKPDVTLSIVKSTPAGEVRRVYYTENVFRRSRQTGEYREIHQMGLEFIGGGGAQAEAEVLGLALEGLATVGDAALDLSHMEFIEAMLSCFEAGEHREAALEALRNKSPHGMQTAAVQAGLGENTAQQLAALARLSGPFAATLPAARGLAQSINDEAARAKAMRALDELEALGASVQNGGASLLRLDFSILNDADYYNGLIFQGFVQGAARPVLGGGRYDNLLHRFGKPQGALGFALYLDVLSRAEEDREDAPLYKQGAAAPSKAYLNVALPKGRMGTKVYQLFVQAGLSGSDILDESRKLVFDDEVNKVRYFMVKPSDVDIYVEHGAADIGVVGKDVLLESGADVLELLDLKLGACRLAVAGYPDFEENPARPLRVASKYPKVARRYYAAQSRNVEIIQLHGSIELAPILGLSDVIVDIVESGATLKENNLAVLADVAPSSARLIANRTAWRFKGNRINTLVERLGGLV